MNPAQFFKYGNAYQRYRSGNVASQPLPKNPKNDPDKEPSQEEIMRHHVERDVLQVAKAVGSDLSKSEFMRLYDQVESLRKERLTNRDYQSRLWSLPDSFREGQESPTHYSPTRLSDNTPADIDPNDPKGLQERFKGMPEEKVKHDQRLHDLWMAAQNDQLATLMENQQAWQASSDPSQLGAAFDAMSEKEVNALTEPLKHLLLAHEFGSLQDKVGQQLAEAKQRVQASSSDTLSDEQVAAQAKQLVQQERLSGLRQSAPGSPEIQQQRHTIEKTFLAGLGGEGGESLDSSSLIRSLMDSDGEGGGTAPGSDVAGDGAPSGAGASPTGGPEHDGLDHVQAGLDAYGFAGDAIVPGSGVAADGINAAFSLVRAVREPHRAGEHVANAGISLVSMVPFVGDAAKLLKYGSKGARSAKAAKAAAKRGDVGGMASSGMQALGARRNLGSHLMASLGWAKSPKEEAAVVGDGGEAVAAGGGQGGGDSSQPPVVGDAPEPGGEGDGDSPLGKTDKVRRAEGALNRLGDSIVQFWRSLGPVGRALAYVTVGFFAVKKVMDAIGDRSEKLLADNRELANYSGTAAVAYAQLDRDRILRQFAAAQGMGGPLQRLAQAQSGREQAMEDLTRPFKMAYTDTIAGLNTIATYLIQIVDYVEPISEIIQWWYGDEEDERGVRNAAESLGKMFADRKPERKL